MRARNERAGRPDTQINDETNEVRKKHHQNPERGGIDAAILGVRRDPNHHQNRENEAATNEKYINSATGGTGRGACRFIAIR